MGRKKKHEEHVNHERWLVSYADFITLLFAFFTTLYAIGESDRGKAQKFITSVNTAFNRFDSILQTDQPSMGGRVTSPLTPPGAGGGSGDLARIYIFKEDQDRDMAAHELAARQRAAEREKPLGKAPMPAQRDHFTSPDSVYQEGGTHPTPTPTPTPTPVPTPPPTPQPSGAQGGSGGMSAGEIQQLFAELEHYLDEEGLRDKVSIKDEARGVVISLSEAAFFDPGQAELKVGSRQLLDGIARTIAKLDHPIQVEGHTDNTPVRFSRYSSNWELSAMRALRTAEYLVRTYGFEQSDITPAGHGDSRPIAPNSTPEGRSRNRRVDIVILDIHTPLTALPAAG